MTDLGPVPLAEPKPVDRFSRPQPLPATNLFVPPPIVLSMRVIAVVPGTPPPKPQAPQDSPPRRPAAAPDNQDLARFARRNPLLSSGPCRPSRHRGQFGFASASVRAVGGVRAAKVQQQRAGTAVHYCLYVSGAYSGEVVQFATTGALHRASGPATPADQWARRKHSSHECCRLGPQQSAFGLGWHSSWPRPTSVTSILSATFGAQGASLFAATRDTGVLTQVTCALAASAMSVLNVADEFAQVWHLSPFSSRNVRDARTAWHHSPQLQN